jgi:hypothetical protein
MSGSQQSCVGTGGRFARAAAFWLQAIKTFYSEYHNIRFRPYAFLMRRELLFN